VAQLSEAVEGEPRDGYQGQRRRVMLGHPRGQQKPAATRLLNHKVGAIRIAESPQNHDALAGARVMRISDDNFKQLLLGSMSPVRREP